MTRNTNFLYVGVEPECKLYITLTVKTIFSCRRQFVSLYIMKRSVVCVNIWTIPHRREMKFQTVADCYEELFATQTKRCSNETQIYELRLDILIRILRFPSTLCLPCRIFTRVRSQVLSNRVWQSRITLSQPHESAYPSARRRPRAPCCACRRYPTWTCRVIRGRKAPWSNHHNCLPSGTERVARTTGHRHSPISSHWNARRTSTSTI